MNNIRRIEKAKRAYYTIEVIRQLLGISDQATRLFCTRAVKSGELVRARRGLYLLSDYETWYRQTDYFRLANLIQTPSYISLLTALAFYDISTQVPISTYESIASVRPLECNVAGTRFLYFQTNNKYYFGFTVIDNFFIAEPEKALIDAAQLISYGKYSLDLNAIDFSKLNEKKLEEMLKIYPKRTINLVNKWRKKYGTIKTS